MDGGGGDGERWSRSADGAGSLSGSVNGGGGVGGNGSGRHGRVLLGELVVGRHLEEGGVWLVPGEIGHFHIDFADARVVFGAANHEFELWRCCVVVGGH